MRRVSAASALLLGVAACSLFTPLSGYSNGADDPRDGGPHVEGGNDGTIDDGSGGTDAPNGPDAPPNSDDASTTGFCKAQSPTPALCMDFDDGTGGPPSGWTSQLDPPGGVQRVSSPARSSPSALRAWVDPGASVRHAYWARPIGTTVTHARLSYSMFVEERPTTDEVEINMLRFDANTTQNYYYLALQPTKAEYWEQYNTPTEEKTNAVAGSLPIDTGKWQRISVEVNLGAAHSIVITVDGNVIVSKPLTQPSTPGIVLVNAGITWANANANKAAIVFDDVLFEILP